MNPKVFLLFFLLLSFNFYSGAQDTIVMLSGKTIVAKNVEVSGYSISYRGLKEGSKVKHKSTENVFAIRQENGIERIVYQPDSTEEEEFTVDQMRMYVKGEQDAMKYYRNHLNKVTAFVCGAGASYFTFYGIIGPAIYSTVVGSFSPVMEKQKVSDPSLIAVEEYREGYQRKVRDKKIKNSILYGLAGFAAGFTTLSIVLKNK